MIKIQNLTIDYPDKTRAIDGLDMTVNEKDNIALMGENGSGKTTLLLAICGVLEAVNGTITVDGIQLAKKTINEIRRKTGLVFQNPDDQLFMPLIFDDVAFGCRNFGMAEDITAMRVDETLAQLNIGHLRGRSSLNLSSGEKRMAAIATVLAMQPSILMFDEPTAFLDHKARRRLIESMVKLQHTKIIATHDLAFAEEVCNRVLILKDGRIAANGSLSLLYDKELMDSCGLESVSREQGAGSSE